MAKYVCCCFSFSVLLFSIQREGKGTLTMSSGEVYEGHWDKDMRTGMGKATYTNGDVYEGLWMHGLVRAIVHIV